MDDRITKKQGEFLLQKAKKAERSAALALLAQKKAQEKLDKAKERLDGVAEKKAERLILDATAEERTSSKGHTVSALVIMRVVDYMLRFPSAKQRECAEHCNYSMETVKLALSTPMAKSRLETAYDVRPMVQERLKNQAMNAMEYLEMVSQRAVTDIQNHEKAPDAPLMSAAVRSAIATLQGVGVLKEHQIMKSQLVKQEDIHELVSKTDQINASFQEKLEEAMKKSGEVEFAEEQQVEGNSTEN